MRRNRIILFFSILLNLACFSVYQTKVAGVLARISHQDLEFWDKLAKQVGRLAAEA